MTNADQAPSEPAGSEAPDRPPTASRSSRSAASPASRRRADRVGDLLPERTRDETSTEWGDEDDADADEHLRREVPPHHG
jgi:hypothetical protein